MRSIGRYEVRKVLCRGTTPLLDAVDTVLERPVVIRALSHALAVDPERRTRFLDAAMVAARLVSPHIAPVLDLGDDRGDPYVVMELPEGPSLRSVMDEPEPRPVDFRLDLVSQLCDALAHAHRHGMTQLGLRPSGVFVTQEGRVTVVPFGTVPLHGSRGTLGALGLEEVAYLAPEQVDGRVADRRADIFTLGAIAFELMARRRPFAGTNIPSMLHGILNERPDPSALPQTGYSPGLENAILKALARDPDDRYSEADTMLVDLESLVLASPAAPPPTAAPPATRADADALRAELRRCLGERRWDEAHALCTRLREVAPDDQEIALGEAVAVEGQRREAETLRAEALSLAAEGRVEEALALADVIEARAPGDPRNTLLRSYVREEGLTEALMATARQHVAHGNLLEARAAAEEALALNPSRPRARALLEQIDRVRAVGGGPPDPLPQVRRT